LAARIFAARGREPPITSPERYGALTPSGVKAAGMMGGGAVWQLASAMKELAEISARARRESSIEKLREGREKPITGA
jgi:hypothetical protein